MTGGLRHRTLSFAFVISVIGKSVMSRREIEGRELVESGNVVQLQPSGAIRAGTSATAPRGTAAADTTSSCQTEAITRDGLELLKAFFAIDDAAARAALVILAQRFAELSSRK
jgi:hypothetical protein